MNESISEKLFYLIDLETVLYSINYTWARHENETYSNWIIRIEGEYSLLFWRPEKKY